MTTRIAKLVVAMLAGVCALLAGAPGAFAAEAPDSLGGVSLRPANGDRSASYFTLNAAPGTTLHDAVLVANNGAEAVNLVISPVDGLTGQTSGAVYANREDPVRAAGRWVTPSVTKLTLAGKRQVALAFSVSVPEGASPGDHLAGIAVENTKPQTSTKGFAVKQVLRTVIGVRVVVPGKAAFVPSLSTATIDGIGVTKIGAIDIGLANRGNQLAKPSLRVNLTGPSGYSRSIKRELDTILPGDAITYPFAWPDHLAKGQYEISAALTGGGKTATLNKTVELGVVLTGASEKAPTAAEPTQSTGIAWWTWLLIILAAAAVFGGVVGMVLRRGHPGPHADRAHS